MSKLQICNNLLASVPLLSDDQYKLLFQLDKQLTEAGILTNLSSMAYQPNSLPADSFSTTGAGHVSSADIRSICSHKRDDENERLPYDDLEKKREQWETLFEQYKDAKRASFCGNIVSEGQYVNKAAKTSSLLHLQGCESQIPGQELADEADLPVLLEQTRYRPHTQSTLPLSSEYYSDRPLPTADVSPVTGANQEQATLTPGRVSPPSSPANYPQADALVQRMAGESSAYRLHWPSISFLSQNDKVQFPKISYFLDDNMRLSGLQTPEMIPLIDDMNSDHISKSVALNSRAPVSYSSPNITRLTDLPAPATSLDCSTAVHLQSDPTNMPINSNLTPNPTPPKPSGSRSKSQKGSQPKNKKAHVPTRRWSQTYLNGLIHKHQPRNLPDGLQFTDHTNVQEIPLERLVPPIKAIDVEVDGEIRFLGAGTRAEDPFRDGYGWVEYPVDGTPTQIRQIVKETPFRLVTTDKEGRMLVDMNWTQDVAPFEDSTRIVWDIEPEECGHIQGKCSKDDEGTDSYESH